MMNNRKQKDRSFEKEAKRWKEWRGRTKEGQIKRIKVCYAHVSTHHDESNHHVLQIGANKNKNFKKFKINRQKWINFCLGKM